MSELFLELFSEEVPAKLQIKAREQLKEILKKFFEENSVKLKNEPKVFSTPNRIAIKIERLVPSNRVDNSISDLLMSDITEPKENKDIENKKITAKISFFMPHYCTLLKINH